MPRRLLRMVVPADEEGRAREILEDAGVEPLVRQTGHDERLVLEALLEAQGSQEVLDELEKAFHDREGFRMVLLAVEAVIPRDEEGEEEGASGAEAGPGDEGEDDGGPLKGVSRDEVYQQLADAVEMDRTYLLLTVLSAVVAAVGILGDNTPVVIGAMVIAPLLGPMVALAFATTLADVDLGRGAVVAGIVGTALTLALSSLIGWGVSVNPEMPQIASRISLGYGDLVLALASGSAGVLSMTAGVATALVGVMVAVALLPPLVTAGLLFGAGFLPEAGTAFLAFLAYVIGINLAGVVTFLAQGVRPLTWWEADRARRATRRALVAWLVLLAGLSTLVTWLR